MLSSEETTDYSPVGLFNWRLLAPVQGQQEPPIGDLVKKDSLFIAKAQWWYSMAVKTAGLRSDPGARPLSRQLCPAPCGSTLHCADQLPWAQSAPFCDRLLWPVLVCSTQLSQGNTVFCGKAKCALRVREEWAYMDRSPLCLVPDWSVFMQMRNPNPHSLV